MQMDFQELHELSKFQHKQAIGFVQDVTFFWGATVPFYPAVNGVVLSPGVP